MPATMLKSLANKAGISLQKAETLWDKAKKLAAEAGREDDYAYITGILKKSMGLKEGLVEDMISKVLNGSSPHSLLEAAQQQKKVRTFYDAGLLHVATLDDILVEPGIDSRVDTVLHLTNDVDWPVDHPLCDFEFEGELDDLYNDVLELSNAPKGTIYTSNSRKRRAGARKAQRTKLRKP